MTPWHQAVMAEVRGLPAGAPVGLDHLVLLLQASRGYTAPCSRRYIADLLNAGDLVLAPDRSSVLLGQTVPAGIARLEMAVRDNLARRQGLPYDDHQSALTWLTSWLVAVHPDIAREAAAAAEEEK